jgi:hypothetical protein
MSKEYIEPEEKDLDKNNSDDAIIMDDFNPLDEAVSEKEYTKHNVKVNPNDFVNDIPEPSFMPPPMMGTMNEEEKVKKPQEPFNPQMNDMPKKDKHDAAGKVAEMIMSGYKFANQMADNALLFNERKIAKLQRNGEIDLSVEVPISPSATMSAGEFIQEFNDQSKGTISVTKEFEEEVTPVLTRVLEKRGIGMTDEQLLIYLFGKDILVKGFMVAQSLNVKKDMLNMLKEATTSRVGGVAPQPSPQPSYTPQPEPTPQYEPQPQQEEVYSTQYNPDTNVNDFVNQMTGGIPQYQEEFVDEMMEEEQQEEKPKVKIISKGTKKPIGKRGRPSKKK